MTPRGTLSLLLFVVLGWAAFLGVRQRTLNQLRTDNESLRHTLAPTNASKEPAEALSASPTALLTAEEKSELLRLRGQIVSVRSEAAEASNRVARLSQPARTAAERRSADQAFQEERMNAFGKSQAYQVAQDVAKAMQRYMNEHSGQIPADLRLLQSTDGAHFPEGTLARFELIRSGAIADSEGPYILIAREKEPRQLSDETWLRIYIQANGGVTIAGPLGAKPPDDDADFLRSHEQYSKATFDRARRGSSR